ncbi:MAG: Na(+)-translocating NADH-quinone reductase subunit A [Paludibacteraceae bacterium]|nr:Na(+)-translocating NADH-quinone reductase subunit A [Paludibacteraceae bacterium]MDD6356523.1 Na(+)-translocating NADH-quinone reductase subunit A [Bacteroidales bacterium]
MNQVKLKRGLDIKLKGCAERKVVDAASCEVVALVPDDFYGIVPKLLVREGDAVKIGTPVFYDKNHPEVKVVSPVCGEVKAVNRGERRKIMSVEIALSGEQNQEEIDAPKEDVFKILLETGLFAFFKQRPYDIVADPNAMPKAIFISAFDSAPLAPDYDFVLADEKAYFQKGVDELAKLSEVYVGVRANSIFADVQNAKVTAFDGPHPAGNVGVQINHLNPINKGEVVWVVNPADVAIIGKYFATGKLDFTRIVALAGSEVKNPCYVRAMLGAPISAVVNGNVNKDRTLRYINGNPLSGVQTAENAYLSAVAHQVTVIPEGDDVNEMLGWIAPRFSQFSVSRSYFSWLRNLFCKQGYTLDARVKGGERHMIMSGEYDSVLPMDILPEYLIKAIIAWDIDKMEALGIYEVAPEDFALCEFVDSSKLELQHIVRKGLDDLREEMA